MRYILLGPVLIASSYCFGQQTFSGQILSIVDSLPIHGSCPIRVDNKKLIFSDSSGIFTISTTKRKIRLTIEPATIFRLDTVVNLKSLTTPIKLFIPLPIDSTLALFDIAHNRIQIFCGGGYAPIGPMPSDKDFEALYSVKYLFLDCVVPPLAGLESYNKAVADYLDKKYGDEWRQKLRPNVFNIWRKVTPCIYRATVVGHGTPVHLGMPRR